MSTRLTEDELLQLRLIEARHQRDKERRVIDDACKRMENLAQSGTDVLAAQAHGDGELSVERARTESGRAVSAEAVAEGFCEDRLRGFSLRSRSHRGRSARLSRCAGRLHDGDQGPQRSQDARNAHVVGRSSDSSPGSASSTRARDGSVNRRTISRPRALSSTRTSCTRIRSPG
jgi:hypothetical protein